MPDIEVTLSESPVAITVTSTVIEIEVTQPIIEMEIAAPVIEVRVGEVVAHELADDPHPQYATDADVTEAIESVHTHDNAEALALVSGENTGDQDLSPYVLTDSLGTASAEDVEAFAAAAHTHSEVDITDLKTYALDADVVKTVNGTAPDEAGNVVVAGGGGGGGVSEVEIFTDTKEPTGWLNPADVVVSYDNVGKIVTLTGDLTYYWRGAKNTLAFNDSDDHLEPYDMRVSPAMPEGSPFLSMTVDETEPSWKDTRWEFSDIMVAYVTSQGFAVREPHGCAMSSEDHEEAHDLLGTYVKSAVADIQVSFPNAVGQTRWYPAFEETIIKDEDCPTTIDASDTSTYTLGYPDGEGFFAFAIAETPFTAGVGGYINYYNPVTAAVIQGTSNNKYYNIYELLIPVTADEFSQSHRRVMIQPQYQYSTPAAAQAEDPRTLNLQDILDISPELVLSARITYKVTAGNTTNYGHCELYGVTYLRGSKASMVALSGVYSDPTKLDAPVTEGVAGDILILDANGVPDWIIGASPSGSTIYGHNAGISAGVSTLTAIGYEALNNNTGGGGGNTAVGFRALKANVTGGNNTAVGADALTASVGVTNTAIGQMAAGYLYEGAGNVAIGEYSWWAGRAATGDYNVMIGCNSGLGFHTGDGNTVVGGNAGSGVAFGENMAAIGYGSNFKGSNTMSFGDDRIVGNYFKGVLYIRERDGGGNTVGIQAAATMTANYIITMPDALPAIGEVLKAVDAVGNLEWGSAGDANAIVDGDFVSAGFMKTDGSGGYSVDNNTYLTSETIHTDVLVDSDFSSTGFMKRGANPGDYTVDNSTYITGASPAITTPTLSGFTEAKLDAVAGNMDITKSVQAITLPNTTATTTFTLPTVADAAKSTSIMLFVTQGTAAHVLAFTNATKLGADLDLPISKKTAIMVFNIGSTWYYTQGVKE